MSSNLPARRVPRRDLTLDEIARVADAVGSGALKDAPTPRAAGTKMLMAQQLGFSPMAGLLGIDYIDGRPKLSARMLLAAVRRHPLYDYRVPYAPTRTKAAVQVVHRQTPTSPWEELPVVEFTIDDAKLAGLASKPTFTKYPQAMLYWRAARQAVDFFAPEVSLEWGAPPQWEEVDVGPTGEVELAPAEPEQDEPPEDDNGEPEPAEPEPEPADDEPEPEPQPQPGDEPLPPPLSDVQRAALMAGCNQAGIHAVNRKRLMRYFSAGRFDSTKAYPRESFRALMQALEKPELLAEVWAAVERAERKSSQDAPRGPTAPAGAQQVLPGADEGAARTGPENEGEKR